jgi:putative ABC transport system permease protein
MSILSPRARKVLADLWANRTRTLLVVASIAVGAFAVGAITTTYVVFGEDIAVSYAAEPGGFRGRYGRGCSC